MADERQVSAPRRRPDATAVTIRPARPEDVGSVRDVLGATWHATYDGIYGRERVADIVERWHSLANLQARLASDQTFLVAEEAGRIVGTATAAPGKDDAVCDLKQLYVLPGHQGRGVGRRLLAAALAPFPKARQARLEVEPANAQAIAFYERAGFAVTGRVGDCCGTGDRIAALVMTRALG